jgi:hypothetical protein
MSPVNTRIIAAEAVMVAAVMLAAGCGSAATSTPTPTPSPTHSVMSPAASSTSPSPSHSAAPPPTPPTLLATSPVAAPPASCYPTTSSGHCYEPGEYCRTSDHGASGVAGDGTKIICQYNNGWRWEPVSGTTPSASPLPSAPPAAGGGGTAGFQDALLLGLGVAALLAGAGSLAYRRRLTRNR